MLILHLIIFVCISGVATQSPPGPQLKCKGVNEVYYSCVSSCGDGCDLYRTDRGADSCLCTSNCKLGGCACRQPDFYRHPQTEQCVNKDQCPTSNEYNYNRDNSTKCPDMNNQPQCENQNEIHLENGPECGDGCVNHVLPSMRCVKKKYAKGCFCKEGYHRDPQSKQCVMSSLCPSPTVWDYNKNKPIEVKACGLNERKKWLNKCWESCSRRGRKTCNQHLIFSCFCTEGYCRNKKKQCVSTHWGI